MPPNNSTMDSTDDSIDNIVKQIKNIVINDKRCLSYTHVSQRFGVRVDIARNILKRFVSEQQNDGHNMAVKYFLCGNCNNDDDEEELKIERFLIVDECELDSTRALFKNLVVEDIYSVSIIDSDGNVPKLELNFVEYECEVTNESQLKHIQSLTFKRNDSIGFRDIRRRMPPLRAVQVNGEQNGVKLDDKSDSKTKVQPNKNKKQIKRKNNIKSMFSKNSKNIKKEVIEEETRDESNMDDNDPFKSDSEDDIKEESGNDKNEQNSKMGDREETMSLNGEDVVEMVDKDKNVSNNKRSSKEQNISSDEDEDEEIVITRTKKSKRFKRVRVITDSDEEEEDKESDKQSDANHKRLISSAKRDELKPFIKRVEVKETEKPKPAVKRERVEVQETHVDDDGFTVTKTVKKDLIVDENENCDYLKPIPRDKKSNEVKEKAKTNANSKTKTLTECKKTKSLKDTSNMKQMSITNFFKPKVSA